MRRMVSTIRMSSAGRRPAEHLAAFMGLLVNVGLLCSVAAATDSSAAIQSGETLEQRLEALDPDQPSAYFELAEEVAEGLPGGGPDKALARRLYGLAGRLDPDGFGASAALGIAWISTDGSEKDRFQVVAARLDPGLVQRVGQEHPVVDAETAMKIADALAGTGAGRWDAIKRVLADNTNRKVIRSWEDSLTVTVAWLEQQAASRAKLHLPLTPRDSLGLIRLELMLLDPALADWSTTLGMHGDPPLIDIPKDDIFRMLLDDESASRRRYRGGAWVE
jgi:hypothetical protein